MDENQVTNCNTPRVNQREPAPPEKKQKQKQTNKQTNKKTKNKKRKQKNKNDMKIINEIHDFNLFIKQ